MAADARVAGSSNETRFAIPGVPTATPRTPAPTSLTNTSPQSRKLAVPIAVAASVVFMVSMAAVITSRRHAANEQENKEHEKQEASSVAQTPREPQMTAPDGMSVIKGATFKMGRDSYNKPNAMDTPAHDVTVKDFAIDRTEVTVGAYKSFVDSADVESPWPAKMKDVSKIANLPVVNVSADDARAFCRWRYPDAHGRLPTEEEWEWAARAPDGRVYPWGNEFERTCVNGMKGESGVVMAADRHTCGKSATGLLDMAGNVWEWTASKPSAYSKDPSYPVPTQAEVRVIRGGSFFNTDTDELTGTVRRFAGGKNRFTGFRCAADVKTR
jgi:formylglycine-generating enzyme required for sulfatase activity